MRKRISAAAGVFLLVAGSAQAITVSTLNPNSSAFLAMSSRVGGAYSGVVELQIVRPDLGYGVVEECPGALLSDGVSVLTSAHCVADSKGADQVLAASVTFGTSDGVYSTEAVNFQVDPSYNGSSTSPNDVAVLTLVPPAPDDLARDDLYTGDTSDQADYPFGVLREGDNEHEPYAGTDDLTFDFTDPPDAPYTNDSAPGDSGGPSFIDGKIAGVHSYFTFAGDIDPDWWHLTSSFRSELTPEPSPMILLGVTLIAVSLIGRKRHHR